MQTRRRTDWLTEDRAKRRAREENERGVPRPREYVAHHMAALVVSEGRAHRWHGRRNHWSKVDATLMALVGCFVELSLESLMLNQKKQCCRPQKEFRAVGRKQRCEVTSFGCHVFSMQDLHIGGTGARRCVVTEAVDKMPAPGALRVLGDEGNADAVLQSSSDKEYQSTIFLA